jgi:hypothetical protein
MNNRHLNSLSTLTFQFQESVSQNEIEIYKLNQLLMISKYTWNKKHYKTSIYHPLKYRDYFWQKQNSTNRFWKLYFFLFDVQRIEEKICTLHIWSLHGHPRHPRWPHKPTQVWGHLPLVNDWTIQFGLLVRASWRVWNRLDRLILSIVPLYPFYPASLHCIISCELLYVHWSK